MNYPVQFRQPSPPAKAYAGDSFSDSDDEQLATGIKKLAISRTPRDVEWSSFKPSGSVPTSKQKDEKKDESDDEQFFYPAEESPTLQASKPICTSPVDSVHGFSRSTSPSRPRGPSTADFNGSEQKKRRIDSGFIELSEGPTFSSQSVVESVDKRPVAGLGWDEEPRDVTTTVNGWTVNVSAVVPPFSQPRIVEINAVPTEVRAPVVASTRQDYVNSALPPVNASHSYGLAEKKREKTVSLDEFLEANGQERITCDKCGSILSKKEFEARTGGSGIKAYALPNATSSNGWRPSDSDNPSHSVSHASSRKSEASYETMSPSFPPGYIPEDIQKGWGSGYVSAASSRRSAASSCSIPHSLPDGPTPEDLKLGWAPVDGPFVNEPAGSDNSSDVVVKKAIEQISAMSIAIGKTANEKAGNDITRPTSPVSYRMSAASPASTIVASGWKVEHPISAASGNIPAASDGNAEAVKRSRPESAGAISPARSLASSQATLVNRVPASAPKVTQNGWILPESSPVVDRKNTASPSLLRAQVSALQALDDDRPIKVVGWGDEEEGEDKAPAVGWEDQRPLKQPKSPSYPVSSSGAGRSPENSAAPRDRQLVPSVADWRNGVSPSSPPVVLPASPVLKHATPQLQAQPIQAVGWNTPAPEAVSNGWNITPTAASPARPVEHSNVVQMEPPVGANRLSSAFENLTTTALSQLDPPVSSGWNVPSGNAAPIPLPMLSPINGYATQRNAGDTVLSNGLPKHFSSSQFHVLKGSTASKWSNGESRNDSPPPVSPSQLRLSSPVPSTNGWNVNPAPVNQVNNAPTYSDAGSNGWNVPASLSSQFYGTGQTYGTPDVSGNTPSPIYSDGPADNGQMNGNQVTSNGWGQPISELSAGRGVQQPSSSIPPRFERPDGGMNNANRTPISNARGWGSASQM